MDSEADIFAATIHLLSLSFADICVVGEAINDITSKERHNKLTFLKIEAASAICKSTFRKR